MATLPNPLPKLASLGLDLPPGKLVDMTDERPWHEPLLWHADERAVPGAWTSTHAAGRTAGLLPVLLDVDGGQGGPEDWELMPGEMSYPGDHDAEEVLVELWEQCAADDEEWPGLADAPAPFSDMAPDAVAAGIADSLLDGSGTALTDFRLALVPARRSADIPAAIGWMGPANHENDTARLCAVLRSWEDRFGIRVVALDFDHLTVSVAAPPTTPAEAELLAAEHFAFCPDNDTQADDLLNQPVWRFWWD